jgi:hypothetical protein
MFRVLIFFDELISKTSSKFDAQKITESVKLENENTLGLGFPYNG